MQTVTQKLALPEVYSLRRSLRLLCMGSHDPAMNLEETHANMCFFHPDGNVSVEVTQEESFLHVTLVGPGCDWLLPRLPDYFGLNDNPGAFHPEGKVARLIAEHEGVHLPRLPVVFHRLVQIVLQQLVSWEDAAAAWRQMTQRFGAAAPGPGELMVGPSPEALKSVGYFDLVECGALPRQARLIIRLATEHRRIERLAAESRTKLAKYLQTLPGIGPWTVQYLLGTAFGDPDAVLTGDYSLPHTVAWFLQQKPRSNDAEMLELLAPYRGHRFRVQHLLLQSGMTAPRRGPKMRRRPPNAF